MNYRYPNHWSNRIFGQHHKRLPLLFIPILAFTACLFLLTILLLSCGKKTNEWRSYPENTQYIIPLLDDFSSTRKGAEKLDLPRVTRMNNGLNAANIDVIIMASHVSQLHSNPIMCKLNAFREKIDQFDMTYKATLQAQEKDNTVDSQQIKQFQNQFKSHFTNFRLTKANDFSYINRHLKAMSNTLNNATANSRRMAVIATDFMNHEKGGKPSFVNKAIIEDLAKILQQNQYAKLYIITDIAIQGTPLEHLPANFLGSWSEFETLIPTLFPPQKRKQYGKL